MRSENGSRPGASPAFSSAESLWISNLRFPTSRVDLLPKLFAMDAFLASGAAMSRGDVELLRTARSAKVRPLPSLGGGGRLVAGLLRRFQVVQAVELLLRRIARRAAGGGIAEKCFSTHWNVSWLMVDASSCVRGMSARQACFALGSARRLQHCS